jgi:hypothetical protein
MLFAAASDAGAELAGINESVYSLGALQGKMKRMESERVTAGATLYFQFLLINLSSGSTGAE